MNWMTRFMTAAVLLAAGSFAGLGIAAWSRPVGATVLDPQPAQSTGQKWEYCTVSKAAYSNTRAGVYWVTYYRDSGFQVVDFEDNATTDAALAKAVAKLGQEGWELVGLGPLEVRGRKLDAMYFKRPRN